MLQSSFIDFFLEETGVFPPDFILCLLFLFNTIHLESVFKSQETSTRKRILYTGATGCLYFLGRVPIIPVMFTCLFTNSMKND